LLCDLKATLSEATKGCEATATCVAAFCEARVAELEKLKRIATQEGKKDKK